MSETTHSSAFAKFPKRSNQTTTMLQDNETISPSPMAKSSVIESIRVCSSKQTSPATETRNLPSPATSAPHATTDSDDASLKDVSPFKRLNSFDPKDKNKLQHFSPPQSDYFSNQTHEEDQPIHVAETRSPVTTTSIKTTVNESLHETNECLDSAIKDFHDSAE